MFTFVGKSDSAGAIFGRFIFAIFVSILLFLFFGVFGGWTQENYKSCMDREEYNVSKKVDIYKVVSNSHNYTRGKYDAPFLCVDEYQNGEQCNDDGYGFRYEKIEGKKLVFTGNIIKTRSFNAFTSNSYKLEILIDNKRYWVNKYDFDEIRYGGMRINWPKDAKEFHLKECSLFNLRNFFMYH